MSSLFRVYASDSECLSPDLAAEYAEYSRLDVTTDELAFSVEVALTFHKNVLIMSEE